MAGVKLAVSVRKTANGKTNISACIFIFAKLKIKNKYQIW
jgi:hypothetical protein